MPVLAVIPARLGSARLPRKPLRLLGGGPLVVRVYQRVVALGVCDSCVVATDDGEVVRACEEQAVPAVLTSIDHASGTDRVAEIAARHEYADFDIILNVQGDEPFVSREAMMGAVSMVADGRAPIGTAAARARPADLQSPNVVKVVRSDAGLALYFSRAPIPFLRDAAEQSLQTATILQHVGVYAYTREALRQWVSWPPHPLECIERLEQLRPLARGLAIGVAPVDAAEHGVDTEADLAHANFLWNERLAARPSPRPLIPSHEALT